MRSDAGRRTVLVAGGTRGLGRAIGLGFGRAGARVILTHRWGSVEPAELDAAFAAAGAAPPEVVEADVGDPDALAPLLERVGPAGVDAFVMAVSVVGRGDGTLSSRDLRRSLGYSAWPFAAYVDAMASTFGRPPRHAIALSSDGPDHFYPGYDYVAASKAVLEALCRGLAVRHPGSRVNALRARQVDTTGYREMFGEAERAAIGRFARFDLPPDEVAAAALALAAGDLDGLSGQVVTVDRGAAFLDNLLNVAPVLLGHPSAAPAGGPPVAPARSPGVLWVDAGVGPGDLRLPGPLTVVDADAVDGVPAGTVPDAVVVGCDWTRRAPDDVGPAELLPRLLDRAATAGPPPRYGVRVERGADPATPGEALARTLDRYWGAWRSQGESRLNAVRFVDPGSRASALAATRALLSGALDGMRGQVLDVRHGALA